MCYRRAVRHGYTDGMKLFQSVLFLLFLTCTPNLLHAQFTYTTNDNTITITAYTGNGGNVVIPSSINGFPVTSLGFEAFGQSPSFLIGVTIPDTITNIGRSAFVYCNLLTNVNMSTNVVTIGDFAFVHCWTLRRLTLPDTVVSLGAYAFQWCSALTNIHMGPNIASIQDYAFDGCSNLTSIAISANVTNIGNYAFALCKDLTNVFFYGNAPAAGSGVFNNDKSATAFYLPWTAGWGPTFAGIPTAPWMPQIQVGAAGMQTNQSVFNVNWADGTTVIWDACTNLDQEVWTPIATNKINGSQAYFVDPQSAQHPVRFYRVRSASQQGSPTP